MAKPDENFEGMGGSYEIDADGKKKLLHRTAEVDVNNPTTPADIETDLNAQEAPTDAKTKP